MRLIDADAHKEAVESILSDPNCPLFVAATIEQLIETAPTVDPVHAAGGCYCRECEFSRRGSPLACVRFSAYRRDVTPRDFCRFGRKRRDSTV